MFAIIVFFYLARLNNKNKRTRIAHFFSLLALSCLLALIQLLAINCCNGNRCIVAIVFHVESKTRISVRTFAYLEMTSLVLFNSERASHVDDIVQPGWDWGTGKQRKRASSEPSGDHGTGTFLYK